MNNSHFIVTASEKLADQLRRNPLLHNGKFSLDSTKIISIKKWPAYFYRFVMFGQHRIISSQQQITLIRNIIDQHCDSTHIEKSNHTIKEFLENWRLVHLLMMPWQDPNTNTVSEKLFKLFGQYEENMQHHHLLDNCLLFDPINTWLQQLPSQSKCSILWYGFLSLDPQLQHHITQLTLQFNCYFEYPIIKSSQRLLLENQHTYHEQSALCDYIVTQPKDQTTTLIIQEQDDIQAWQDALILAAMKQNSRISFSSSNIKSLILYPLIAKAVAILELTAENQKEIHKDLLISILSWLQQSSFNSQPLIDQLYLHSCEIISMDEVLTMTTTLKLNNLHTFWQRYIDELCERPQQQTIAHWANYFKTCLTHFGWPWIDTLNSKQFQLTQSWLKTVDIIADQDIINSTKLNFHEAINILKDILQRTPFQTKEPQHNLTITTPEQFKGHTTDLLIITQMDTLHFPENIPQTMVLNQWYEPGAKHPFTHPIEHLKRANNQLSCWYLSAKTVIFSYAKENQQEIIPVSPLISHLPKLFLKQACDKHPDQFNFETKYPFYSSVKKQTDYQQKLSTNAIRQQSMCSLRAFYKHHCSLETKHQDLAPPQQMIRGILVHQILAIFWNELKNQENLLNLTMGQLQQQVIQLCTLTTNKFYQSASWATSSSHAAVESEVISNLILNLLSIEKTRPPFEVVATELPCKLEIMNQTLKIRLDRVDNTENGLLLIDYKTGQAHPTHWYGERPHDPQMLVYSLTDHFSGLLYAKVNSKKCEYLGICKNDVDTFPGIINIEQLASLPNNWATLEKNHTETIDALVDGFLNKPAIANPLHEILTCKECEFLKLCRINQAEVMYDSSTS